MIAIACYQPLKGFFKKDGQVRMLDRASTEAYLRSGRVDSKLVSFFPFLGEAYGRSDLFDLPCGRCVGCRLSKAKEWTVRLLAEQAVTDSECWFLTLTYNDDELRYSNEFPTLVPDDHTKFFKDLREFYREKYGITGLRFYMCAEYGSLTLRPHFHYIIFGMPVPDLKYHEKTELGDILYTSDSISKLWPYGWSILGEVTAQSCSYVARYVQKKADEESNYTKLVEVCPEFQRMSLRPGIGAGYVDRFADKIYKDNMIYLPNGLKARPSRYFYDLLQRKGFPIDLLKMHNQAIDAIKCNESIDLCNVDRFSYLDDLKSYHKNKYKALTRHI